MVISKFNEILSATNICVTELEDKYKLLDHEIIRNNFIRHRILESVRCFHLHNEIVNCIRIGLQININECKINHTLRLGKFADNKTRQCW